MDDDFPGVPGATCSGTPEGLASLASLLAASCWLKLQGFPSRLGIKLTQSFHVRPVQGFYAFPDPDQVVFSDVKVVHAFLEESEST